MQSRRIFIGKVASGLAGAIAAPNVLASSDRIRLGIVGPGDRGTQLMREALACPNTEFAGIADIYTKPVHDARPTCWLRAIAFASASSAPAIAARNSCARRWHVPTRNSPVSRHKRLLLPLEP